VIVAGMRFCPKNYEIAPRECRQCGIYCVESEHHGCMSCMYRTQGRCCNSVIEDREIRIIRLDCPEWKTLQVTPEGVGKRSM